MKRAIITTLIAGTMAAAIAGCSAQAQNNSREYPDCGVIIGTDENKDLVTIQMQNGNMFDFYGIEDYFIGDLVAVIMNDNGTPEVYDDEIISTKYVGWIEDEQLECWVK